jgi:hypothetical protein
LGAQFYFDGVLGKKMIPFISYVTRDEHGDSHVNLLEEKEKKL